MGIYERRESMIPQKQFDKKIKTCPCCGKNPHWLMNIKNGFSTIEASAKCEKCGAVLHTSCSGIFHLDKCILLDVGLENNNSLIAGNEYQVSYLDYLNRDNYDDEDEADYKKVQNKKELKVLLFIFGLILFVGLITTIVIVPTTPSSNNQQTTETTSGITYSNYMKIQNGMSLSEVRKILGSNGTLESSGGFEGYTMEYWSWQNTLGTKIITICFENGKVSIKTQVGL